MNSQLDLAQWTARTVLATALGLASVVMLAAAPPSDAGPKNKTFEESVAVDGATPAASVTVSSGEHAFTFALKNLKDSPQAFGSARIQVPNGFTVTGVQQPAAPFSLALIDDATPAYLLLTSSGPTGSGVAPGATLQLGVTVSAPSSGTCNPTWTTAVKQSNDFSGAGNEFTGNSVTTDVAGGTHLVWTQEPVDTQYGRAIAPVATMRNPCGDAVNFNGVVTATDVTADPTHQTYLANALAGVATFSITYATWGYDHVLDATAPGAATCDPSTDCRSASFHVYQLLRQCSTDGSTACSSGTLSGPNDQTRASVDSPAGTDPAVLSIDIGGSPENPTCSATTAAPALGELVTFNISRPKAVTLTLPKAYVNLVPNNGTPFMDICLEVPTGREFVDKFGNAGVTSGLLPDCTSTRTTVCITSRSKRAGSELITFVLPAGDPRAGWY